MIKAMFVKCRIDGDGKTYGELFMANIGELSDVGVLKQAQNIALLCCDGLQARTYEGCRDATQEETDTFIKESLLK